MQKCLQGPIFWGSFTAVLYTLHKGFHVCVALPRQPFCPVMEILFNKHEGSDKESSTVN